MKRENQALFAYLKIYQDIRSAYLAEIQAYGLPLAAGGAPKRSAALSLYGWKSPACAACRKGDQSVSYYLSLMCHRSCYYCFNPNQEHYALFRRQMNNAAALLRDDYNRGRALSHIALTGGEPLLHPQETMEFFRAARALYPQAYLRLYTSGDLLEEGHLISLKEIELDEIRFSIKLEDDKERLALVCEKIALAGRSIGKTMVEMPVIPGSRRQMQELLLRLNGLQISGINLLEFCFPFHNAIEFKRRGFQIKNPPFEVFYNYDYAGGLPVAGSEELCLELLRFSSEEKLSLGVHYCSFAAKLTAQIFSQNSPFADKLPYYFSPKDYFFKSIKVFGADAELARAAFLQEQINAYKMNLEHAYLEFHPRYLCLPRLAAANPVVGIAYYVVETRDGAPCLREVHLEVKQFADVDLESL